MIEADLAAAIADKGFIESVIAPDFSEEALRTLTRKPKWGKNVRLMKVGELDRAKIDTSAYDLRAVVGGMLAQSRDLSVVDEEKLRVVTKRQPTDEEMASLLFGFTVGKHVKSNAIILTRGQATVGVGAGQMSRIDAFYLACRKAGDKTKGSVLASDAFFPFRDVVEAAAEVGVTAIIQPGGALRDEESIAACDEKGLAMVFSGQRHFRH